MLTLQLWQKRQAPSHKDSQEVKDDEGSVDPEKEGESKTMSTDEKEVEEVSDDTSKHAQESSSKDPDTQEQPKDASASSGDPTSKDNNKPSIESPKDWFTRITKAGHSVMWPSSTTSYRCPMLLTGVRQSDTSGMVGDLSGWERKLEAANLGNHLQYLRGKQFVAAIHPMKATAGENGFVPETRGLSSDQLEQRIQRLLHPLAYVVSGPRQPITAGNEI